jgi:hypothetical protein
MTMRLSRTALLASVLLLGARTSAAQTIPSPYRYVETSQSAGVFAGYHWIESDITLTDSTEAAMGPQSGPMVGVRYQIRASGPLSIDGSITVTPTQRELFIPEFINDSSAVIATDVGVSVPSTVVEATLGLRFYLTGARTWRGFAPFAAAGAGLAGDVRGTFDEERDEDIEQEARFRFGPAFAVSGALGTDWFATENASLRVELSGKLWQMETPTGFLFIRATGQDEWNPVVGLSVGGAFHF